MLLTRRSLLAQGLAAGAALLLGSGRSLAADPPASSRGRLRFSSWLKTVKGDLPEQLAWIERMGFEAIELRGPWEKMHPAWKEALQHSRLVPSALDWGNLGAIVGGTAEQRQQSIDSLKRAIDVAADLRVPNLIIVPPRLKGNPNLPDPQRSVAIIQETLGGLAPQAVAAGTCLMIEPVVRSSVNCMHTVGEVAAVCRAVGSPGVGIVGDFSQMMEEEKDLGQAFQDGGSSIRQVHLASRHRRFPGEEAEDRDAYRAGFRGLQAIGYDRFCSFECSTMERYMDRVGASMDFLRTCWKEA